MSRISRNLTTIYRTERLIARRSFAVLKNQMILVALAGVVALIALVLVNISLFFVLEARMTPAAASGVLALVNIGFAGLLAALAGRINVENEIAPAVEVRDMAIQDLEVEIEDASAEVREMMGVLKGLGRDPLGSLSALVVPLLAAFLKKKT